jgi:hypothetical protein
MPGPNKTRNAFADPYGYMREVGAVNRKVGTDLEQKRTADIQKRAEINARNAKMRKLMAPKQRVSGPRYANPFPVTDESREAERQADELLRIRQERRNAFSTKPKG